MENDTIDLEQFLNYLQDKVQDCYKEETKIAIKRFLEELY
jgi:hypothetical protein